MKNKKIIICFIIIVILGIVIYSFLNNKTSTFYLEDEYYNNVSVIDVNVDDVEKLIDNKSSFLLFTYNNYCSLPISCEGIFEQTMDEYNITLLQIPFEDFKELSLHKTVELAPSVIIVKKGKIIDYLNADSDEDLDKYQSVEAFSKWLKEYIIFTK